jgi:hypothetical protein
MNLDCIELHMSVFNGGINSKAVIFVGFVFLCSSKSSRPQGEETVIWERPTSTV